jgi:hypothetical protein
MQAYHQIILKGSHVYKKIVTLCIFVLLIRAESSGQNPKGPYTFYAQSISENNVSYIKFSKDSFVLLSLKNNAYNGKLTLDKVGSGNFSINKNRLLLNFTNENNEVLPLLITDSLQCSFSTVPGKESVDIFFRLIFQDSFPKRGTLHIETAKKDYNYTLESDSISIHLPEGTVIRSIKFFLVQFDARVLPFDHHFNTFQYCYTLRDKESLVELIDNTELKFSIESSNKDGYRFKNGSSLIRTDQKTLDFLNRTSSDIHFLQKILGLQQMD